MRSLFAVLVLGHWLAAPVSTMRDFVKTRVKSLLTGVLPWLHLGWVPSGMYLAHYNIGDYCTEPCEDSFPALRAIGVLTLTR